MTVKFSEKFGLPKDRIKLVTGIKNFDITKIEIRVSRKKYNTITATDDGNEKLEKKIVPIAYIDTIDENKVVKKYFSLSKVIVESIKEMYKSENNKIEMEVGKPYVLKEPVFIAEVLEGTPESGGKSYLFFS